MTLITRRGQGKLPTAITRHPAYVSWAAMKQGCRDPKSSAWKSMGAYGCTYPERWNDFNVFITEMGNPPEGYTLARRDLRKSFSLENCVWAPKHRHHIKYQLNPDHVLPAALRGEVQSAPEQFIVVYVDPETGKQKIAGPYPTKERASRAAFAKYGEPGEITKYVVTAIKPL